MPSQHVYRSLRRMKAREAREADMLHIQLQLSQLKFEHTELLQEVMWWRSWYHGAGWQGAESYFQDGSKVLECTSGDCLQADLDIQPQGVVDTMDANAERCRIDMLLQELGALVSPTSEQESTNLDSVLSTSCCASSFADNCSVDGATNKGDAGARSFGMSSCMGRGRGLVTGTGDTESCNAKRFECASPIGCSCNKSVSSSGGTGQGNLKLNSKDDVAHASFKGFAKMLRSRAKLRKDGMLEGFRSRHFRGDCQIIAAGGSRDTG